MASDNYWMRQARRLSRRRLLGTSVGMAALLTVDLTACGQKGGNSANMNGANSEPSQTTGKSPRYGDTLVITGGNAGSLDPHRGTSASTMGPVGFVTSRLFRSKVGADPKVAEDHEVEGDLAISAESTDAVTWTVKLRPNAKFHNIAPVNGHAVEAEDVKATFTRALNPLNPNRTALDMVDASHIQTPDKQTVTFKLNYPYASFNNLLASSTYSWILPREALAGAYDPAKQMIGSGPFTLESYTPDVGYSYKKNPDWFEQGRPYVDGVQAAVVPNQAQAESQFTGRHLDILGSQAIALPIADIATIQRDNPQATVIKADPAGAVLLYVQLGDPTSLFQDIRARRGMSMAIDRDALNKSIDLGDAQEQWYVYLDLGKWALHQSDLSSDTAQYYKYDPTNAKKLLDAAGVLDHPLKLVYGTVNGAPALGQAYGRTSEALANMLQSVGLKVTLSTADYAKEFIGDGHGYTEGYYDKDTIVSYGISVYDDVDLFLHNLYYSTSIANVSRVKDPTVDAMITKARSLLNEDARRNAYLDVQKYLADKMYSIAGFPQANVYIFTQSAVRNYQHSLAYGIPTESYSKLWLQR